MTEEARVPVTVASPWSSFAVDLAAHLESKGAWHATPLVGPAAGVTLSYGPGMHLSQIRRLCDDLQPVRPELRSDAALGAGFRLEIGDERPLDAYRVTIKTDVEELAERVRTRLEGSGFHVVEVEDEPQKKGEVKYGGLPAAAAQALSWQLAREGQKPAMSKAWPESDMDVFLLLVDEELARKPARQRHAVYVVTDDDEVEEQLKAALEGAGFTRVRTKTLEEMGGGLGVDDDEKFFGMATGPFKGTADATRLQVAALGVFDGLGVDVARFPLKIADDEDVAAVVLPVAAWRAGRMRPYDGPWPERFKVEIYTDRPGMVSDLTRTLREAGFSKTKVNPVETGSDQIAGFSITWGAASKYPEIADAVRAAVDGKRLELGAGAGLELRVDTSYSEEDSDIRITIPVEGVADGSLLASLTSPGRFDCVVRGVAETSPAGGALKGLAERWKFRTVRFVETGGVPGLFEVAYGAAPPSLVEKLAGELAGIFGRAPSCEKRWSTSDHDVTIFFDAGLAPSVGAGPADDGDLDLGSWLSGDAPAAGTDGRSFLEVGETTVRVGPVDLPRHADEGNPLVPAPGLFLHYCVDDATAATLLHVATSVALREACLLEGETSTSKTSSIQFLASLLRQPVARLNLNGQTDTGDLIGRWVPQTVGSDLPFEIGELRRSRIFLEPETREILETAEREGRPLRAIEIHQVMANERMRTHPWAWRDGLVVQAARYGWWVILDEVNLAEPQILERLNSLLEREPSLVLTESDGSVLGPGGTPIHPDFRVFATMNPAEYAGRTALSPAYRNRWRGYRMVPDPGERGYLAMARRLVFGVQPDVHVQGRAWPGLADGVATHGVLAMVPGIEGLLEALVRFHVALENATGQKAGSRARIGVRRKERYVFTRRDLLSVLDYLASPLVSGASATARALREAVQRYYLGRVQTAEDRRVVVDLLDAAGIGPKTWSAASATPAPEVPPERDELLEARARLVRGLAALARVRDSVDPGMTLDDIADEFAALLPGVERPEKLPARARALCGVLRSRFRRPESAALGLLDKAILTGAVEGVEKAFRRCAETERAWFLAEVVGLIDKRFPNRRLDGLLNSVRRSKSAAAAPAPPSGTPEAPATPPRRKAGSPSGRKAERRS